MPPDLVGAAEIMMLLGVSRQRVDQLARRPDFPKPIAELSAGRIWSRDAIEDWARTNGREIKEA